MSENQDEFFENIYKRSYDSQFLSKEICRKCFDTANQVGFSSERQVECLYEDLLDLMIDVLKIKKE